MDGIQGERDGRREGEVVGITRDKLRSTECRKQDLSTRRDWRRKKTINEMMIGRECRGAEEGGKARRGEVAQHWARRGKAKRQRGEIRG